MLAVTILYPRTDDSTFDMEYFTSKHMPMFAEAIGDACQGWGAAAVGAGNWAAMGWVVATDQESFNAAMAEHGKRVRDDVPNYTNVRPEIVVGEITGGSE